MLDAIYGPDGRDESVVDAAFNWDGNLDVRSLRVGYLRPEFEREITDENRRMVENDQAVLEVFRSLGVALVPLELPTQIPVAPLRLILNAEAAAAFDELTRSNRDDLLVRQVANAWPNAFRQARLIPAVEYIQANRIRRMVMGAMHRMMEDIDVYVAPSFGGANLLATNLTGHPSVVLPNGFSERGTPTSITFVGKLFGEAALLGVAKAYQDATPFHHQHPPAFSQVT